jgi:hypothetical protein
MSNSIWKMRDIEPKKYPILALGDDGKYYVFESPKLGTGDLGWKHRCHDYVKHYCYLDNLIAKANMAKRLEEENEAMREEFEVWHGNHKCVLEDNERLQKAVDKAIWILEESKKVQRPDFKLGFTYCLFPQPHLDIILDEIKQLIKGE